MKEGGSQKGSALFVFRPRPADENWVARKVLPGQKEREMEEGVIFFLFLTVVTDIVDSCRTESPGRTFAVRLYPTVIISVGDRLPTSVHG